MRRFFRLGPRLSEHFGLALLKLGLLFGRQFPALLSGIHPLRNQCQERVNHLHGCENLGWCHGAFRVEASARRSVALMSNERTAAMAELSLLAFSGVLAL